MSCYRCETPCEHHSLSTCIQNRMDIYLSTEPTSCNPYFCCRRIVYLGGYGLSAGVGLVETILGSILSAPVLCYNKCFCCYDAEEHEDDIDTNASELEPTKSVEHSTKSYLALSLESSDSAINSRSTFSQQQLPTEQFPIEKCVTTWTKSAAKSSCWAFKNFFQTLFCCKVTGRPHVV